MLELAEKGKNRSKKRGTLPENSAGLTEEQVKAAKEAADAQMQALIEAEEATKVSDNQNSLFYIAIFVTHSTQTDVSSYINKVCHEGLRIKAF